MKRIMLAFERTHFSEGAFEFARKLNELQPILLTGVFLPQTCLANLWAYAGDINPDFISTIDSHESELVQHNIARFERLCEINGIDFRIREDYSDLALSTLKKESRYADLLILGSEVLYGDIGIETSCNYLSEVLHNAACPVLLVPEKLDFPDRIILAYDGREESVYAIKQFTGLFPELTGNKTLLVDAKEDADDNFSGKKQLEEFAARHYRDLTLFKLILNPNKYFKTWLTNSASTMLISGSYGHTGLSKLFKRSFVNDILVDHKALVFIAYR